MLKRCAPILLLTAFCWLVFGVNNLLLNGRFESYGIVPRHIGHLSGILWAPFLHGSFSHLAANTVPLLLLGGVLCSRGWGEFIIVTVLGILLGGSLTWLVARPACHIGASGLIFAYFGYLASLALFRRTFGSFLLSVVCLLAYGGMLRGILPTATAVSWEGHAAGLFAGVVMAWFMAKLEKTPVQADLKSPADLARKVD
jgi:membrane associated rhomboid family serine protease